MSKRLLFVQLTETDASTTLGMNSSESRYVMTNPTAHQIWAKAPSVEFGSFLGPRPGRGDIDLNVAYAGNSVTAQRNGYQVSLHDLLTRKWSVRSAATKLALGAVGSMGLASYWDALIRDRRPAAVFLECSTADMGQATPDSDVGVAVIHLVNAIRRIGADVCFLHLPRADQFASRRSRVLAVYSKIARELGIASIDLEFRDDLVDSKRYLYDGVHTTELGGRLIAEAVIDALMRLPHSERATHLQPFLEHDSFLRVNICDWQELGYDCNPTIGTFRLSFPFTEIETSGSATWTSSTNVLAGLKILLGPHSGVIQLSDGERTLKIQTWDETCDHHPRLSYVPIPLELRGARRIIITASNDEQGERDLFGLVSRVSRRGSALRLIGCVELSNDKLKNDTSRKKDT